MSKEHDEITALLDAEKGMKSLEYSRMCSNLRKQTERVFRAAVNGTFAELQAAKQRRREIIRNMQRFKENGKSKSA